jgi:hypothetical protein
MKIKWQNKRNKAPLAVRVRGDLVKMAHLRGFKNIPPKRVS